MNDNQTLAISSGRTHHRLHEPLRDEGFHSLGNGRRIRIPRLEARHRRAQTVHSRYVQVHLDNGIYVTIVTYETTYTA